MASDAAAAPQPLLRKLRPLERDKRLSQSLIFPLLRRYYVERGPEAWQSDAIPYFVTSNRHIADAYARAIAGFLRDVEAAAPDEAGEPLYIVELAAGLGRFGHGLLQRLQHHRAARPGRITIKYVMTDTAERNLDALAAHPKLRPLIEAGTLELARFDAGEGGALVLRPSGKRLAPGSSRHPVAFIANYLFDSLPQDAFRIAGGALDESLITLAPRRAEPDLADPSLLSRVDLEFAHRPARADYYDEPAWNRILAAYRSRLPETSFLFPVGALRCLDHLKALAGGRLLLLSGDKGYSSDAPILHGLGAAQIALHGESCFSMMVDYQIIGEAVAAAGGAALHQARAGDSLAFSAFLLGVGEAQETRLAFADTFERFGADDAASFARLVEIGRAQDLPTLLAVLRFSEWDATVCLRLMPGLKAAAASLSPAGRDALRQAAARVAAGYFPVDDGSDALFALGTLLLDLGFHAEALGYFEQSAELHGPAPGTAYNIALCAFQLGQRDAAKQWLDCALGLDPGLDPARRLRAQLAG